MKKLTLLLTAAAASVLTASFSFAGEPSAVLDSYVKVADALAKDDLSAAKTSAKALAETAKAEKQNALAADATKIASSASIDDAREAFKAASTEAEKLAAGQKGYHIMTCPMAKADWVQKSAEVKNPYFGQSMSDCGSEKKSMPGMKGM